MDRKEGKLRNFAILYGSGYSPTQAFVDDYELRDEPVLFGQPDYENLPDTSEDFSQATAGGKSYMQLGKALIEDLIKASEIIDDETISCKDPSSGVKCPKVKKGKHYKPFYQKGRY